MLLATKNSKQSSRKRNPLAISKSDTTGGLSNRVNVQEAKEFKVTLELRELPEDIQTALRPGMSSTATITTDTKNNVLAVPLESIVEKAPTPAASPGQGVASRRARSVTRWRETEGAKRRLPDRRITR